MNPQRLLQHFDRIAEAPDAVARLRRFILDLAVRGKLVERDPSDEPASALVGRMDSEKVRLVKSGAMRKPKPLPPIRSDELPVVVPRGWTWVRLCDLGMLSGGMTPSKNRPDYWRGDIVWLSPKDIKADEINDSELKITSKGLSETRLDLFPVGSLFMVARSGILKRTFPVAINRVPAASNQDLKVLVPYLKGNERYLQIMFRGLTDFILRDLVKTGTTVQSLKYAAFEIQPFPLPPLAEQHRIVAKVDELMALCDRLEGAQTEREQRRDRLVAASLSRLNQPTAAAEGEHAPAFREHARFHLDHLPRLTTRPEHIKSLRQTILNLAVRGKLVGQNAEEEPVRLGQKNLEPMPRGLPRSWRYLRLEHLLAESTRNGYSRRPDDALDGVPILRISAGTIREDGLVAEEEHKLISGIDVEARLQYGLTPGDLLACRFNGNKSFVGRLKLFSDYLGIRPIYPDKLIRVRVDHDLVLPAFVRLAGDSDLVRNALEALCATTVGNWGISASKLKEVPFPLPPLKEQHRIVAKVDELMAICNQLEAELTTTRSDSRRLLEAVLHEALA